MNSENKEFREELNRIDHIENWPLEKLKKEAGIEEEKDKQISKEKDKSIQNERKER